MTDRICLFEDQFYRRLLPLVYTRPAYDLRCGMLTLREKVGKRYPGVRLSLHSRGYLADLLREENPGTAVNRAWSSERIASCRSPTGREPTIPSATFGPTPVTVRSRPKNPSSSGVRKPYSAWRSSLPPVSAANCSTHFVRGFRRAWGYRHSPACRRPIFR